MRFPFSRFAFRSQLREETRAAKDGCAGLDGTSHVVPQRRVTVKSADVLRREAAQSNYPAAGKAEIASRLAIDDHCLGLPEPGR